MTGKKSGRGDRAAEARAKYNRGKGMDPEELLERLRADPLLRARFAAVLGIPEGLPEALTKLADEIKELRLSSERRFEAMDKRFDALRADMNARFEAMDKRFEALRADMNARFEAMDRRFEAMDKRFEALRADMNARFEAMDGRFDATDHKYDRLEGRANLAILAAGQFGQRLGAKLEDIVAGAMRFAFQRTDIGAENVRLRQKFVDQEGKLGRKGRQAEADIVVTDDRTYIIEVKSVANRNDVESFHDRARFVAGMMDLPEGAYEPVLVTLDKPEELLEACREFGVTLA